MTYTVSSGTLNSTIPSKVDQVNSMVHTVYKNYWNLVKLCPGNLVRFLDTLILQMWLCGGGASLSAGSLQLSIFLIVSSPALFS